MDLNMHKFVTLPKVQIVLQSRVIDLLPGDITHVNQKASRYSKRQLRMGLGYILYEQVTP